MVIIKTRIKFGEPAFVQARFLGKSKKAMKNALLRKFFCFMVESGGRI